MHRRVSALPTPPTLADNNGGVEHNVVGVTVKKHQPFPAPLFHCFTLCHKTKHPPANSLVGQLSHAINLLLHVWVLLWFSDQYELGSNRALCVVHPPLIQKLRYVAAISTQCCAPTVSLLYTLTMNVAISRAPTEPSDISS